MVNFCTLFNSNYAARGLAMYYSLERTCKDYHLYIFAFDSQVYYALQQLRLSNVSIVSLDEFEDDRLLKVKDERTSREYCWTCEALTIQYCLSHYDIDNCTYIDADLMFYSDPQVLIDEMGNADVLLTEHRYASNTYYGGRFCVQFMTFKKTPNGMHVLNWWCDKVLEWCHEYEEDGKFGDQMYLEDWPERFSGIHVLKHLGGGVAPWNSNSYHFDLGEDCIYGTKIDSKEKFKLVFYHFHNLHIQKILFHINRYKFPDLLKNAQFHFGSYTVPYELRTMIYEPYVKELVRCSKQFPSIDNPLGIDCEYEDVSFRKYKEFKSIREKETNDVFIFSKY